MFYFNALHLFNDGLEASLLLLLPFIAKDLHINLAQVGLLGTMVQVLEIFISFPAGYFASRLWGFKTFIAGVFLYSLGFLLTGFAQSFFLIVLTFFIAGIGFGSFHSIALGAVARKSESKSRGRIMSNFMAIGDIGKIALSTVLSFLAVSIGWRNTSHLYALCGFILLIFVAQPIFKMENFAKLNKNGEEHLPFKHFLKNKQFVFANFTNFLDSLSSSSIYIFLPFLLIKRGINPAVLGGFTAMYFIGNLIGRLFLGRLTDKHGASKIFVSSELLMALFIYLLANTPSQIMILVISVLLGMFARGTTPITKTMVSQSIEKFGNFEKGFGINSVISSTATSLSPLLLGLVSNSHGVTSAFNISASIALLATLPALAFYSEKKKTNY